MSNKFNRKDILAIVFVLMACMLTSSIVIKVVEHQGNRMATLSLRGTVPPSGEVLFMVESSPYVRYLRSAVGIDYNGKEWDLEKTSEVYEYLKGTSDKIEMLSPDITNLSRSYHDFDRDVLNGLTILDDPQCLQLPDNISPRVRYLSRRITESLSTPFEKAKAIETFLQVRYEYELDYTPAPSGWEPNDWFLFESKKGICGNFNSAFVILARASGIPARLAAGYYLLPGNGEPQPVYASQAHAWAEVGFDGPGWLAFEATPP